MDTRKKESYRKYLYCAVLLISNLSWATDQTAFDSLKDSFKIGQEEPAEIIKGAINRLQKEQCGCKNPELKERIDYRIGMLNYRVGNLQLALEQFNKIILLPPKSLTVLLFSINMAAQINRMDGQDVQALHYYSRLIQTLVGSKENAIHDIGEKTFWKLYVAAIYGKSEIQAFHKQYPDVEKTYKSAIILLCLESSDLKKEYLAALYDRLSQIYLMTDRYSEYNETIIMIQKDCPEYWRLPLILLEAYAIHFLKNEGETAIYSTGSADVSVRLIDYIKNNHDQDKIGQIESKFQEIMKKSTDMFSSLVLKYHYAWFLDAIGKKEQSYQMFSQISDYRSETASETIEKDFIIHKLISYSKLQMALLDGEMERYKEGLECLNMLARDPNDKHVVNMTDSLRSSLEVLKREVPKNEK